MVNPKFGWARKEKMNKLLSLLLKHGKLRNSDLKKMVGVSDPTLASYIRDLEKKGKIQSFFKPSDRRERLYKINSTSKKSIEAELGRYEAIRFIEGISNPIYAYEQNQNGTKAIAAFASGIGKKVDGVAQKSVGQIAKQYLKLMRFSGRVLPNQRIAVVIMVKGKE